MKQRISFNVPNLFKDLKTGTNLIIELRTNDPNKSNVLKSTAWTVMPLFNPADEFNIGRWRLPMYQCPTLLGVDLGQIPKLTH
jgi:hypothetical protein